jgi:hypothetical protein
VRLASRISSRFSASMMRSRKIGITRGSVAIRKAALSRFTLWRSHVSSSSNSTTRPTRHSATWECCRPKSVCTDATRRPLPSQATPRQRAADQVGCFQSGKPRRVKGEAFSDGKRRGLGRGEPELPVPWSMRPRSEGSRLDGRGRWEADLWRSHQTNDRGVTCGVFAKRCSVANVGVRRPLSKRLR